eukprot:TRINITY_DN12691_c0_g1_i1.p1 TRINITY_DN12691_c0_g1~~TRINITY_DN12691_c0_g1_i1.p1  ORF type:complete len:894 (+),score=89.65 TRINITY_DN12691_c0_g1_i1:62-2683(+)
MPQYAWLLLILVQAVRSASGNGAVWWDWQNDGGTCVSGGSNGPNQEWIADGECINAGELKKTDPMRFWGADVSITCVDRTGSSIDYNAKDDTVVISFYKSSNASCKGAPSMVFSLNYSQCGSDNPATAVYPSFRNAKFQCSRCNWLFYKEAAPPYMLQGVGIVLFLMACIAINYLLQDRFDRLAKNLSQKSSKEKGEPDDEWVGKLVEIAVRKPSSPVSDANVNPLGMTPTTARVRGFPVRGRNFNLPSSSDTFEVASSTSRTPVTPITPLWIDKRRRNRSSFDRLPAINPPQGFIFDQQQNPLQYPARKRGKTIISSSPLERGRGRRRGLTLTQVAPEASNDEFAIVEPLEVRGEYLEHGIEQMELELLSPEMRMCIVCGERTEQGTRRKTGWKCTRCVGKRHVVKYAKKGGQDEGYREVAMCGGFGGFAEVYCRAGEEVLCSFTNPVTWVPKDILPKKNPKEVSRLDKNPDHHVMVVNDSADVHDPEATYPAVRLDTTHAKVWSEILKSAHKRKWATLKWDASNENCLIMLNGSVGVWLDAADLTPIGSCGAAYVRVKNKADFRAACGDLWKEWWMDFELCVGLIQRVYVSKGVYMARVGFKGSAVLDLPTDALMKVTKQEHFSDFLTAPQKVTHRTMMAVFVASSPPLLALKGLFLMGFFGKAVWTVFQSGHEGRATHHSAWLGYEEVYFKLFNVGYPTLMADCGAVVVYFSFIFKPTASELVSGVGLPIVLLLLLSLGISLPAIITHAIPMMILYSWLWIPLVAVLYHLLTFIRNRFEPTPPSVDPDRLYDMSYFRKHHKRFLILSGIYHLSFRVAGELLMVVFLQTNYNYGVLAYGNTPYFKTITEEFKMRQLVCVWEMGIDVFHYIM